MKRLVQIMLFLAIGGTLYAQNIVTNIPQHSAAVLKNTQVFIAFFALMDTGSQKISRRLTQGRWCWQISTPGGYAKSRSW
ncbi:MAG: hypothetical protein U5L96_21140 [Owenweeksia sp.]|nr:hypothetical protein [Owenweeksia sp.]